jgi:transcriptional regulator with XRE-family HTH domain
MSEWPGDPTPGQCVAWHRIRRGLSQEVLAGLVGRTEDWLSKIENDRAPLDRLSVIRSLAKALGVTIYDLIEEPAPVGERRESVYVDRIRAALTDYRQLSPLLSVIEKGGLAPRLDHLSRDLDEVMSAYQASQYGQMLRRIPELLTQAQFVAGVCADGDRRATDRVLALASQSAAMILTKLGQSDLAWVASQRGLVAAERSEDPAVIGSLLRSVVHSLLSEGRVGDARDMTRCAAEYLRSILDTAQPRLVSVYGTLLLPGAIAAARSNDRDTAYEYLSDADDMARLVGRDVNHLWTAFGPTNVKIHQLSIAMSLGDVQIALDLVPRIDARLLPAERRVRHALEVANAYYARNRINDAVRELLLAEKLAPEQVHEHVMSRQLVLRMHTTAAGKRDRSLAALASRMKII